MICRQLGGDIFIDRDDCGLNTLSFHVSCLIPNENFSLEHCLNQSVLNQNEHDMSKLILVSKSDRQCTQIKKKLNELKMDHLLTIEASV